MACISTLVFFDLETTGLPHQEHNRTKIVELSFIAATRSDILRYSDIRPPISKLSLVLNPKKTIHSASITGLSNDIVKHAPTFKEKFNTIKSFLDDLKKPVCLVAHNGNIFDYRILLAECVDADVKLPADLLCCDSLSYYRKIFKTGILEQKKSQSMSLSKQSVEIITDGEITDDEDEWPELNVTPEELQEIDELCSSLSDLSCESLDMDNRSVNRKCKNTETNKIGIKEIKPPKSLKLTDIYKTLIGREPQDAHRAEGDCLMLLQCIGVCQNLFSAPDDFMSWVDNNCKLLNQIKPLTRK